MDRRRARLVPIVLAAGVLAALLPSPSGSGPGAAAATALCGTTASIPTYRHVIVIVFENHSYRSIIGAPDAPYFNKVAKACGLATNFHNVTHKSLPNYLAMTSGASIAELAPYLNDCQPASCSAKLANDNVFNQVAPKGWLTAAESMPSNCALSSSGTYATKHNPALYYTDLAASCPSRDVPLGTTSLSPLLLKLANNKTAPAYTFIEPNMCSDMHDCSVATGNLWLKTWLPKITGSAAYRAKDTAIFVVFDEGSGGSAGQDCLTGTDPSCHIPAIVIAPSTHPGTRSSTNFNLYSMLRTTEDLLKVGRLGGAATAKSMAKAFRL